MLASDHLPLRESGPYSRIFINVSVVTTIATVMLLWDFGSYWIIFTIVCLRL